VYQLAHGTPSPAADVERDDPGALRAEVSAACRASAGVRADVRAPRDRRHLREAPGAAVPAADPLLHRRHGHVRGRLPAHQVRARRRAGAQGRTRRVDHRALRQAPPQRATRRRAARRGLPPQGQRPRTDHGGDFGPSRCRATACASSTATIWLPPSVAWRPSGRSRQDRCPAWRWWSSTTSR
jgi:hypothetical protein